MKKGRHADPLIALGILLSIFILMLVCMVVEFEESKPSIGHVFLFSLVLGTVYFALAIGLLSPPNRKGNGWGISGYLPASSVPWRYLLGLPLFVTVYLVVGLVIRWVNL